MMLSLNSNVGASSGLQGFRTAYARMFAAMQKLSSGFAINGAADDPAGLVISEQLRSRIGSLNAEIDALSANINRYETASSTISEMQSHLTELRSLAVAAVNEGGNSEEAQRAYATAANDIAERYNDLIAAADYGNQKLFGTDPGALADIPALSGVDLSTPEAAAESLRVIDDAQRQLSDTQIALASEQKYALESRRDSLEVTRENLIAAESRLRDTDYASTYSDFVAGLIQTKAAIAMLAHANIAGSEIVKLLKS